MATFSLPTLASSGADGQFNFDPLAVGSDVGQYYTSALSSQPGYSAILRNIKGIVSPDVKRQLGQAAAERGVGIGSYGGANDASALLQRLGLTSMDLTNKGLAQYQQAFSSVPALSPTSLFVTPTAQAEMNLKRQMQAQELEAAAQRQAESQSAAERLARINQQTQYGLSGAQLDAQREQLAVARADRDAIRKETLSNLASYWGSTGVPGTSGGIQSDRWYAGTNTSIDQPEAESSLPSWWGQGASSSPGSGMAYYGPDLSYANEEALMGGSSPEELGLDYYDVEYF